MRSTILRGYCFTGQEMCRPRDFVTRINKSVPTQFLSYECDHFQYTCLGFKRMFGSTVADGPAASLSHLALLENTAFALRGWTSCWRCHFITCNKSSGPHIPSSAHHLSSLYFDSSYLVFWDHNKISRPLLIQTLECWVKGYHLPYVVLSQIYSEVTYQIS